MAGGTKSRARERDRDRDEDKGHGQKNRDKRVFHTAYIVKWMGLAGG